MEQNSFWQTERGKAIVKLGLWLVFILALIIFALVNKNDNTINKENEETEEKEVYEFKKYDEMIESLLDSNYEFNYDIVINDTNYLFNGTKCNNEVLGYKESNMGIIKYYISDNTYQVVLKELVPIENLYENIDINYLDLNILFNNLNEYLYNIEKNDNKRTITYKKDGYQVEVITNLDNITNINITVDNNTYNLSYNVIDACNIGVLSE
ncbi:MAG: hypothetical protein ACLUFU_02575 [Bacilli bacterium]